MLLRVRGMASAASLAAVLGCGAVAMGQAGFNEKPIRPGTIGAGGLSFPQPNLSWPQTNSIHSIAQAQREAAAAHQRPMRGPLVGPFPTNVPISGVVGGGGGFIGGGGFSADGRIERDRFRARFHVGSPAQVYLPLGPQVCYGQQGYCPTRPYGYYYNTGAYINYTDGYAPPWGYAPPVLGDGYAPFDPRLYQPVAPPAQEQTPTRVLTVLEQATENFQAGEYKDAVSNYRRHLATAPTDAPVLRLLAAALIASGQMKEGVATMGLAYRTDPALADRPLDKAVLPVGQDALSTLTPRVVNYAHRINSASAWLSAAALMQAQGKTEYAAKMIDKAKAAGLEKPVAAKFDAVLLK